MPLFIADHPFHDSPDNTKNPVAHRLSVRLRIRMSRSGERPSDQAKSEDWAVDLGFDGEAMAYRYHLDSSNIQLTDQPILFKIFKFVNGNKVHFPLIPADLWLVSNVIPDGLHCLATSEGVCLNERKILTPTQS